MDKLTTLPDACFPQLGIAFQELNRVAFTVFGIEIYWYGLFICTGVILAICLLSDTTKRTGQDFDLYIDFAFCVILSGIIGARVYYLVFNEGSLKNFFAFRDGGLAIYGGIIGGLIAIIIYTRIKKIPLLKFTDTCAPSLLVGQIVGRLGNFVNREAFGGASNGFFRLMYKADEVSHLRINNDVAIYRGAAEYPLTYINDVAYISVHPTFLYELSWNIMVLIIMLIYRKHKRFEGELSGVYFLLYGIGRFLIESIRTDQLMIGSIPVSMLLSAIMVVLSLCFIIVMRKRNRIVK